MSSLGKMIEKLFKDRMVDIFISNFDGERLEFSQFSISNKYILTGKVIKYHDEFGVLELENSERQKIYVNDRNIDCFFDPEVNITHSVGVMIPTGKKLKKDRDIM